MKIEREIEISEVLINTSTPTFFKITADNSNYKLEW